MGTAEIATDAGPAFIKALGNRQGGGAWSIFLGEQGVAKTVEKTCLEIECLFEGTLLPQTDKRYWVRLLSSDARPVLWILRDELLGNPRRRPSSPVELLP